MDPASVHCPPRYHRWTVVLAEGSQQRRLWCLERCLSFVPWRHSTEQFSIALRHPHFPLTQSCAHWKNIVFNRISGGGGSSSVLMGTRVSLSGFHPTLEEADHARFTAALGGPCAVNAT